MTHTLKQGDEVCLGRPVAHVRAVYGDQVELQLDGGGYPARMITDGDGVRLVADVLDETRRHDWQGCVRSFHEATGNPVADSPTDIPDARKLLRLELIAEESSELCWAMGVRAHDDGSLELLESDMPEVADAIADLLYVVLGTAVEYGIDIRPIFDEVHDANMRKQGGPVRADGKTLKPEGWQPPNIAALLAAQGYESVE